MTTNRSRKDRGMATQAAVANYLKTHGWPFAESAGAGRSGVDVTGTVDIAVEVKARSNFEPLAWVRQAVVNADGRLPFAVMRCNGQGPADIDNWVALVPFGVLVRLLREAGYGDGAGADQSVLRAAVSRLDGMPAAWPPPAEGYCTCNGTARSGRMADCGIAAHREQAAVERGLVPPPYTGEHPDDPDAA